ncbi:LOW QUALITY PROTEIN: rab15 effector protein [Odontesthes bonariensis]
MEVWALLEKPTKNPKIQTAVRVLHLPEREGAEESSATSEASSATSEESSATSEASSESTQMESSNRERTVHFCTSVGRDCYALFLFFEKGRRGNIYGVPSNNFGAANRKCINTDRAFRIKVFRHTTKNDAGNRNQEKSENLILMIKFN